jgi:hypothetical protein
VALSLSCRRRRLETKQAIEPNEAASHFAPLEMEHGHYVRVTDRDGERERERLPHQEEGLDDDADTVGV